MFLLALVFPPLAVLLTGRPFQALFSLLLLPCYFPAALWALLVVSSHKADKRTDRLVKAASRTNVPTNVQVNNVVHVGLPTGDSDSLVREFLADRKSKERLEAERASQMAQIARDENRSARILALKSLGLRARWLLNDTKAASVRAYLSLPEWAQPISWGLAIGTPLSIVAAALFLRG